MSCAHSSLSRSFELDNAQLESLYARLLGQDRVAYLEDIDYWAVADYAEARRLLSDQSRYSPEIALQPFQEIPPEVGRLFAEGGVAPTRIMVDNPGASHRKARRIVQRSFVPERLAALEPQIYRLVDAAIDEFIHAGEADLVDRMLYELPALVLFRLMDVPEDQVKNIKRWADNRLLFTWGRLGPDAQIAAAREMVDFWKYCVSHVRSKAANPGDDMPSFLLQAVDDDGATLSENEIVDIMFGVLLAGHETTTNQSANTLLSLLEHPPSWRALVEDPAKIPNAVEEGLRFRPSVIAWRRKALASSTIAGAEVPAGANLLILLAAANRDARVFAGDPSQFDIERADARKHIAFGYGAHFCLGAPLARLEMRVILERLTERIPGLRLRQDQRFEPIKTVQFRGPAQLWAQW